MGIYIKNLEMPEFGEKIIVLTSSGYVEDVSGQVIDGVEAISVPQHGRLGDLDVLYEVAKKRARTWAGGWSNMECVLTGFDIKNAPTIIQASEENHNA